MRHKTDLFFFYCLISLLFYTPIVNAVDDFDLELDMEDTPPQRAPKAPTNSATEAVSKEDATPTSDKKEEPSAVTDTQKVAPNLSAPKQQTNYTGADLLSKVRSGLSFNTEEMEAWILNTPNVNTCLDNGQTMLLYLVARYNDAESLRLLIENGADLQTHCTPRYEALFIAAINNPHAIITETLINNGANVVERDYEKNTALMLASAFNPSSQVISTLLDYGLKTYTTNQYGFDALILAAYENGRLPILQTLIDNGAEINSKDPKGHTPLMAAAIRGRDEVMQYLIAHGADFNAVDKNGVSVLDYYNKRYYLKTLGFTIDDLASPSERLSKEFDFIAENHHRFNEALKKSVFEPDADSAVAYALKNLADVDIKDSNGCTALINASRNNNSFSVFEKLIPAGADTNATCAGEKSALMFLSAHAKPDNNPQEQIKKASYLIKNGANINATDNEGNTALMYAVGNQADNTFILNLINAKAELNAANKMQETPLWIAVRQEKAPQTLKLLLEYGADPNLTDAKGETPLWYQLRTNGNEQITRVLLRGGADATITNAAGDTPLWYAINKGYSISLIESIIASKQDLEIKNDAGDTPLLYAVKHKFPASTVKLLLSQGADPNATDINGNTIYNIMQRDQFFDETMKKRNRLQAEDW